MRRSHLVVLLCALACPLPPRPALAHPGTHDGLAVAAEEARIHPSALAHLRLAELHRLAGDFANAAAELEEAADWDPRAPGLDLCRAALALDRFQIAEASVAMERHLALAPEDPPALELRSRIRVAQGDLIGAATDLGRALRAGIRPTPELYVERARLLLEAGAQHGDAALASLEEGIERLGSIPSLELAAVDLDEARGNTSAALARLDRLQGGSEWPVPWLRRRAELLRRMGDSQGGAWAEAAANAAFRDRMPPRVFAPSPPAPESMLDRSTLVRAASIASPPLAPTARIAAVVNRGPYLGLAASNRITIRWRTDVVTDSRVRYGTSLANLNLTVYDPVATTEHVINITGLLPETRYYYSVGTATQVLTGGDAQTSFVTSPSPGIAKATRLWVIGDSGTGGSGAVAVRDAFATYAATKPADLWLMLGDNAYNNGTDAEYQTAVFNMYPSLLRTTPLWPTRGNHDLLYSGGNNDYYELFSLPTAAEAGGLPSGSEAYYSFDYGNIHFVCLDSEGSSLAVGSPMAVWLRADLAATPRDWVIAFWHHPPYSKGSHDSDNEADSGARMGEMRRNIVPILDSAGVDVVLAGHSHNYERSLLLNGHYGVSSTLTSAMKIDAGNGRWNGDGAYTKPTLGTGPREGCVYVVDGVGAQVGGGSLNHPVMISSLNVLGSLVVDVNGGRLDGRFLGTTGAVLDSFTIMKGVTLGISSDPRLASPGIHLLSAQPSRGAVRFGYRLAHPGPTRVVLLDALGRRVRMIRSGAEREGDHEVSWDGNDDQGRRCPPGVYFGVLEAEGRTSARKIVRLGT